MLINFGFFLINNNYYYDFFQLQDCINCKTNKILTQNNSANEINHKNTLHSAEKKSG